MNARSSTLDTSTQGEYTKSKVALENIKDFNGSKRQSQILPPTIRFTKRFKRLMNFLRKNVKKFRWCCRGTEKKARAHARRLTPTPRSREPRI